MNEIELKQEADYTVARSAKVNSHLDFHNYFDVEHWRAGKMIGHYRIPNGITNQGKNHLLDVHFHAVTQVTTWYIGMVDADVGSYTAEAATDTYQNINQVGNGWDEFTAYTDAANSSSATTRPTWTEGAASSQTITNGTPVVFDITGSGSVKGLFLCGGIVAAQTKDDHAADGILWATAAFTGGDVTVADEDQLKVTYSVSA